MAISPLSETASEASLKQAAAAGIKVGLSNTSYKGDFFSGCFSSDNYDVGQSTGKAAAKYIKDKMNGKANIAIIEYKSLLVEQSTARSKGFLDQFKDMGTSSPEIRDRFPHRARKIRADAKPRPAPPRIAPFLSAFLSRAFAPRAPRTATDSIML